MVMLSWKSYNGNITWNIEGNYTIKHPGWKIYVPNVLSWGFKPTKGGQWVFQLGDIEIPGPSNEEFQKEEESDLEIKITYSRKKRSEDLDEDTEEEMSSLDYHRNKTVDPRNWFQKVSDFFFAEGDEARGVPDGIFVKVGKWMRKVSCKMNASCGNSWNSQEYPTLPPQPPIPPTEPDAEAMPGGANEANDL